MNPEPPPAYAPDHRRPLALFKRHGVALGAVAVTFGARLALFPLLGERGAYLPLAVAAMIAAWYGGLGPGLLATLLGALAAQYFFVPPRDTLSFTSAADVLHFLVFLVVGSLISAVTAQLRHSRLEAQEAAAELAESAEQFRLVWRNSSDGMRLTDAQGAIVMVNEAFCRMTGMERSALEGRPLSVLYPELLPERILADHGKCFERGEVRPFDEMEVTWGGRTRWFDLAHTFLRTPGKPPLLLSVFRDIDERKRAEQRLRDSEERLRAVVDNSEAIIYLKDLDGRYVLMNHHWHTLAGRDPREQVVGKTDFELFPRELAEQLRENDRKVVEARSAIQFEEAVEHGGRVRTFISQKFPLCDEAGSPYAVGGISTEITELKRLQTELRAHAGALEEADRRKDEFLAMLAHELRNPLAPMQNAVEMMRHVGLDDPRLERAREAMQRQVSHMARLVDDLLDVSRVTQGKVALRREPVDLAEILEQAVQTCHHDVERRRHELSLAIPVEPLRLEADGTRLVQAFCNLLDNAAKYTEPGGRISLTAARDGEQAVVRVRDSGVGIPAEVLPRIFDLFVQEEQSLDRTRGGLGIGLTLVRRLVELHGGTVSASSEGPGMGSEFVVRLPVMKDEGLWTDEGGRMKDERGVLHPASLIPHPSAKRVLIVEDNLDAAETLKELLELWGYDARVVHNGHAGLQAVPEYQPEVVLLDLGLPGLDGYEVARRLGGLTVPRPLLVAVTGYGLDEDRRRTREAGFDHHLTKPVNPEELRRLLDTATARLPEVVG